MADTERDTRPLIQLEGSSRKDVDEEANVVPVAPEVRLNWTVVPYTRNLYDAPMVSSFGGVIWTPDEEVAPKHAHPLTMFFLCMVLFVTQSALVLYLELGLDISKPLPALQPNGDAGGTTLATQLVLIVIVHLSFFDRLNSSARCILFVINPTTWLDVKRPVGRHWPVFVVAPLSAISLYCRFSALLKVGTVSTSIILSADTAVDAIFDCLAIEFLSFLDETAWRLVSIIFDVQFVNDFTIRVKLGKAAMRLKPCSFLRSGTGGRRFEAAVAGLLLALIYVQHFVEVLAALDTGMIPAARHLCTRAWSITQKSGTGVSQLRSIFFRRQADMISIIHNPHVERYADVICEDKFTELQTLDMWRLLSIHWKASIVFMISVMGLLLLTRVLHYLGMGKMVQRFVHSHDQAASRKDPGVFGNLQHGIAEFIRDDDHAGILSQIVEQLHSQDVRIHEQAERINKLSAELAKRAGEDAVSDKKA